MKQRISIKRSFVIVMAICFLASCSSHKGLVFADREWQISNFYGQIIDKDTTYRMTFGNIWIPDILPIISSTDSIERYPGMDRFISDILHTCRLDSAEILFYAPHLHTMFVVPKSPFSPIKPYSITSPLDDERPVTMGIDEEDMGNWQRRSTDMYTYKYYNRRKKQLLIVDHYDYGDTPIAQITIFQSKNKLTSKMGVKDNSYRAYYELHDINKFIDDVEFWSFRIVGRNKRAILNYKIGQEQKYGKKWNVH